jgi:hypothetical protein
VEANTLRRNIATFGAGVSLMDGNAARVVNNVIADNLAWDPSGFGSGGTGGGLYCSINLNTTGATTDLASFIKNYPESASRVAGMLVMAGVVYGTEGYLAADIINVQKDTESADYVLKNATNLVVAPLDLTEDVVFPYELWLEAMKTAKSPYTKYLLSQTEEWITLQKPITGGFYPFDAVGLSGLLYPEIITRTEFLRLEEDLDRGSPTWSRFFCTWKCSISPCVI